jgi:hypothetical protein
VVCYGGRGLRSNETKWGITDLELLALVEGVKTYHTYLADKPFEDINLSYLKTMRFSGNNRQTRWALFLQSYQFSVRHRKGTLNTSADALSRIARTADMTTQQDQADDARINWTEFVPTTTTTDIAGKQQAITAAVQNGAIPVPAEAIKATRVDRINIEFHINGNESGCIAPISNTFEFPMLDDVRHAQWHCPDFSAILEYLERGTLPRSDEAARKVLLQI